MFEPDVLKHLVDKHKPAFQKLAHIEDELNRRFTTSERPVRALILAVASGEPLLLVGPPGTGKSRLIRTFCGLIGLLNEDDLSQDHPEYFEYLLTPFTEPSELFGFYDISKAMAGKLERIETEMMQNSKVVYLDEVFNGSSAILNSILAVMNERVFHDRGIRRKVEMQCFFAATNQVPQSSSLQAVFDRFVLRCVVDNVAARGEPIRDLLRAGWLETYSNHAKRTDLSNLLGDLEDFRASVKRLTNEGKLLPMPKHPFYNHLARLVQHARQFNLSQMSNRRLVKMTYIMLVHRLYESVRQESNGADLQLGAGELELLPRYFLDYYDEETLLKMERAAHQL